MRGVDVNPLVSKTFALPEHLTAKADPDLIGADERHFAAIAASLEQSIADLSARLDAERKAPGGIGLQGTAQHGRDQNRGFVA